MSVTGASPITSVYDATPLTSEAVSSALNAHGNLQVLSPAEELREVETDTRITLGSVLTELGSEARQQRIVGAVDGDQGQDHDQAQTPVSSFENNVKLIFNKTLAGTMSGRKSKLVPKRVSGPWALSVLKLVDQCIKRELDTHASLTWEQLNAIVLAGALTVTSIVKQADHERASKTRNWFVSIKRKIDSIRADIGKITSELARRKANCRPTPKQVGNLRLLKHQYKVKSGDELTSLLQQLKDRLQLLKYRLKVCEEEEARVKLRRTFSTKTLSRHQPNPDACIEPDLSKIRQYWRKIVGLPKACNFEDENLHHWLSLIKERTQANSRNLEFSWELFEQVLNKAKPWKAPGPDGIHAFWWKVFKQAGRKLYDLALTSLSEGIALPKWLVSGRIVLIHKAGSQEDPANFRPIACLNTSYKLITALLASSLGALLEKLQVLPVEQVAIRKGTWGCTHAMLLDQAVMADATNQKQKPLHVAWIDYAKAFDSVPHAYIKWLLRGVGVQESVLRVIDGLFGKWTVRYEVRNWSGKLARSAPLAIRSGVLQGDSFSPLLFCLAMAPISHAIEMLKCGYSSSAGGRTADAKFHLSHLFYMDDLKIYAPSSEDLEKALLKVAQVSKSISMLVNTKKCARASHEPRRLLRPEESSENPRVEELDIKNLEIGESYKYLGIEQRLGIKPNLAWDRAKVKFMGVLGQVWKLDLTFRQKVNYTNAILPAMGYIIRNSFKGIGTYRSVLKRGQQLDVQVRKELVHLDARYKSGSVERLYLSSSLGGCGLTSVRDHLIDSTIYAWAYVCTRRELSKQFALFQALAKRGKRSVLSDAELALKESCLDPIVDPARSLVLFDEQEYSSPRELARAITSAMRKQRNTCRFGAWKGLIAAGKVLLSGCDLEASFIWLQKGKVSSVVVRNILAAQEGCLLTKASPGNQSLNSSCRMCTSSWETPEHVLTGCSKWLPTLYIVRHDSVVRCIHYRFCLNAGLIPPNHTQSVPCIMENENFVLYWNQPVQTRALIRHNEPDIVYFDKRSKTASIVEVAVSWCTRLEQQKVLKYNRYTVNGNYDQDTDPEYPRGESLCKELELQGWKVTFSAIIVGACGEICRGTRDELAKFISTKWGIEDCIERMSRSSVLGSNRIIKQHLAHKQ